MKTYLIASFALLASLTAQDVSRIPPADQAEATRLFKIYRESTDQAAREQAVGSLVKMHYTVMQALTPLLERDWQTALTNYRAVVNRLAAEVARKKMADPAFGKEVRTLREKMAKLRATTPTKEQLTGEGETSLARLRELHTIATADLLLAQPAFGPMGDAARALTRMRAALKLKTRLKNEADYSEEDLGREEAAALSRAFRTNPAAEKVMEANAALAAKKAVPADEAEGVRDLNEIRMLVGLAPCLIDPKLHDAARGHSKDMATMNFFAHESPVPGKKSPGDRAKLAGTTANAENIHMGSTEPQSANHGWFLSPGHHVNMFGNHRRVGLGRHETHWTQMFGG